MIEFTIETHIQRPVAEVFSYVSDPDELATWQTNIVSACDWRSRSCNLR
jgi:uncharacterized protein YndB with AHSA1/START domain